MIFEFLGFFHRPKQNAALLAHVKKLKDRAKKFGQMTPVGTTKAQKRPSTEGPNADPSPVKQSKVDTQQLVRSSSDY
jgi:hypothetical protein